MRVLEALLLAGQRAGELRDFDAYAMAMIIRSAVGAAAQRLHDGSDLDFDSYAREAVTAFMLATRAPV